jgi:beta-xylosidase
MLHASSLATGHRAALAHILLLLTMLLAACDSGSTGTATPQATTPPTAQATATVAPAGATATTTTEQATAGPTGVPTAGAGEFQNPVLRNDFADPFVLKDGDTFYAYATNGSSKNIQEATSTDLVHWTMLADAMPSLAKWAQLGGSYVWAPEVMKIGSKYVMYYTARDKASNKQCVGVATADKPDGKFIDTNDKAFVCQSEEGGTIDSSPFRDGDKLYLYFKNDGNCCNKATYLYGQELAPDGLSLVGEPKQLSKNDHAWEGQVVEAPLMWKHDGKYYLFFSANSYSGFEYAVGYDTCDSPVGPCEDAPENPILQSHRTLPLVIGPGGEAIVQYDGKDWILYHAWEVTSAGTRGSRRFMWLDQLEWKDGKPVVDGPTVGPQPLP